jgi:hypothetical protein
MSDPAQQLEGGAYEVIRARMETHGADLRARIDGLNAARQELFGAVETTLLATERVATEHNCVPRDIFPLGGGLVLLGYNIQFGLKQTTGPADVFAVFRFDPQEHSFHPVALDGLLGDPRFLEDFQALFKFYRETFFAKFMPVGPHLHMKMRIGRSEDEFKTFKWLARGDGTLEYLGNRFDHECRYPPPREFEWRRAHRDMHRGGPCPHVSIEDLVFVETVGGDLTIKIEDNTASGQGIYSEPVADADQTLDDAEILYALVGPLVLLRILPYREEQHRHFVYNTKTRAVHRLDAIGESCVFLPADQGLIFANGYLLATGEVKTFDLGRGALRFERRVPAANGEDTLFVFYQRRSGHYVLFSYNLVAQSVATPLVCNGFALLDDGLLVASQAPDQPQKHHALQVWRTPFASEAGAAVPAARRDSILFKVGNAGLVRALAECREILVLMAKDDSYGDLYLDLVRRTRDVLDTYFWLAEDEARGLAGPLAEINRAAAAAIAEFDKVTRLRQANAARVAEVAGGVEKLLSAVRTAAPDDLPGHVHRLAALRQRRGEVAGLRELRYADPAEITTLEERVVAATEAAAARAAGFLAAPESLDPYRKAISGHRAGLAGVATAAAADQVAAGLDASAAELELLVEVVNNLKIDDATRVTAIIENISTVYADLNATRAALRQHRRELARSEGTARFAAELKLLGQAVVNFLDLADSPAKCEEFLARLMIQIEELEGRFADFEEFTGELAVKREEINEAFAGRKLALVEARNRRAAALLQSGDRILAGVARRVAALGSADEVAGYFAGDAMIAKLRDLVAALRELGDSVKADALQTRLKAAQDEAGRQLKDRAELFGGGRDFIQLGGYRFSVNTQPLELTILMRDGTPGFHLAGTGFFEEITDPAFLATRPVWDQEIVSEDRAVYRAEWAVRRMLADGLHPAGLDEVRAFLAPRYAEAYTKGVHDEDAWALFQALAPVHESLGLLRHGPRVRALALVFWEWFQASPGGAALVPMLDGHGAMRRAFAPPAAAGHPLAGALRAGLASFLAESPAAALIAGLGEPAGAGELAGEAAEYLFAELAAGGTGSDFAVSGEAAAATATFQHELTAKSAAKALEAALAALDGDPVRRYLVLFDWFNGCLHPGGGGPADPLRVPPAAWSAEAAAHWLRGGFVRRRAAAAPAAAIAVEGLRGQHPVLGEGGRYQCDYHAFRDRLRRFESTSVPAFQDCARRKQELLAARRADLRLDEFKANVMSGFVRNRLIDEVYLPLVGANLAKQIGVAGENTRIDRSGLLLLVSPPGYGKTTLMEYVANRLGLTFMKVNGPALGHAVASLDPAEAPNLSAREEVEKLNLALEMGDNVMIYVDDVQHTSPEFLQRSSAFATPSARSRASGAAARAPTTCAAKRSRW